MVFWLAHRFYFFNLQNLQFSNISLIMVTSITKNRWFAKRFLHPDIVAEYNYIFLWDEDLGVEDFKPERYVKVVMCLKIKTVTISCHVFHLAYCHHKIVTLLAPCSAKRLVVTFTVISWVRIRSFLQIFIYSSLNCSISSSEFT